MQKQKTEWTTRNDGYSPQQDQNRMPDRRNRTIIFCPHAGCCGLKKYLKTLGLVDSARCERDSEKWTPEQSIFCTTFQHYETAWQAFWPTNQPTPAWAPSSGCWPVDSHRQWQQTSWQPSDWGSSMAYVAHRTRRQQGLTTNSPLFHLKIIIPNWTPIHQHVCTRWQTSQQKWLRTQSSLSWDQME